MNDLVKLAAHVRELEDKILHTLEIVEGLAKKMKEYNEQMTKLKNVLAEKQPSSFETETEYQVGDKVRLEIDNYVTTITRIALEYEEDGTYTYKYYFKDDAGQEFYVWECDIIEKID